MEQKPKKKQPKAIWIVCAVILALVLGGVLYFNYGMQRMHAGSTAVAAAPTPSPAPENEVPDVKMYPGMRLDWQGTDGTRHLAWDGSQPPIYKVEPISEDVVNILLLGTDSRKAVTSQASGNADTIILASYNKKTNVVTLVSFMRNIYLHGDTLLGGEYGYLRQTYIDGGVGLLINMLNEYFELDIQSYAAVGLTGFVTFVDETLGGLDMELNQGEIDFINERIQSYENEIQQIKECPPVTDPPGMVHLNGAQTLIFVRNRSTTTGETEADASDFDRVSRQREVLSLMFRKIVAEQPLSAIPGLISFAMQHVETNLTADEIYGLAVPLMSQDVTIESASVPFEGTWAYGEDEVGITFERADATGRLHELLYGEETK